MLMINYLHIVPIADNGQIHVELHGENNINITKTIHLQKCIAQPKIYTSDIVRIWCSYAKQHLASYS
jgi:hypothetical protein